MSADHSSTPQFQWDEAKRQRLIAERKIDILYAALIFENQVLTSIDTRKDYGELRKISIGVVGGECFVVVHTERQGEIRLITAWKAGRRTHDTFTQSLASRS